jgi:hypothetical protein
MVMGRKLANFAIMTVLTSFLAINFIYGQSVRTEQHIRLENVNDKSKYILLSAPTNLSSIQSFEFPPAAGTSGQVLTTNESGKIVWTTPSGSLPSLTAGSMLFSGGGTSILQDNTNLFWDNTAKELGIGTNAPEANLDVKGNFKLGDGGTVLTKIIKTSVTLSTTIVSVNTNVYKAASFTVTGARPNATVIVNPRSDLVTSVFIPYSYVSADDEVTIVFGSTNSARNVQSGTTFDITVIQ